MLKKTDAELVLEEGNRMVEDPGQLLKNKVRELTQSHNESVMEMLEKIRVLLRNR